MKLIDLEDNFLNRASDFDNALTNVDIKRKDKVVMSINRHKGLISFHSTRSAVEDALRRIDEADRFRR